MFEYDLIFERATQMSSEVQHFEVTFQEKDDITALFHAINTAQSYSNGWPLNNLLLKRGEVILCNV